jgi:hypothetical protein
VPPVLLPVQPPTSAPHWQTPVELLQLFPFEHAPPGW